MRTHYTQPLRWVNALLLGCAMLLVAPYALAGEQQHPTSSITAQAPKASPAKEAPTKLPTTSPAPLQVGDTIDINTATVAQFEQLSGIGPKLAQAIWDYRETNGAFERVEDLMNVPGIGQGRYRNMQNQVVVNEDTLRDWRPQTAPATPQR